MNPPTHDRSMNASENTGTISYCAVDAGGNKIARAHLTPEEWEIHKGNLIVSGYVFRSVIGVENPDVPMEADLVVYAPRHLSEQVAPSMSGGQS